VENNKAIISVINNLQVQNENETEQSSKKQFDDLIRFIDDLIRNDFNRLLRILYRVDVSEEKLKLKLEQNKDSTIRSAEIIAHLLVEREAQKIVSREKYSRK
jgi:hypothetical protein